MMLKKKVKRHVDDDGEDADADADEDNEEQFEFNNLINPIPLK